MQLSYIAWNSGNANYQISMPNNSPADFYGITSYTTGNSRASLGTPQLEVECLSVIKEQWLSYIHTVSSSLNLLWSSQTLQNFVMVDKPLMAFALILYTNVIVCYIVLSWVYHWRESPIVYAEVVYWSSFFYTKESLLFIPSESETVSEGPVPNFIDIILEFSKV